MITGETDGEINPWIFLCVSKHPDSVPLCTMYLHPQLVRRTFLWHGEDTSKFCLLLLDDALVHRTSTTFTLVKFFWLAVCSRCTFRHTAVLLTPRSWKGTVVAARLCMGVILVVC